MDSYQGNLHDPVSLHKYLYVVANPVMYTDPTGYDRNLASMTVSMLFRLRALSVVETVSAISAGAIIGMVVDDAINGADSLAMCVMPRNNAEWHERHIQSSLSQTGYRLLLQVFRPANILLPNQAGYFLHYQVQTLFYNSLQAF